MTFDTVESLLARLPTPYTDDPDTNLGRLMQVFAEGLWQPIRSTMDDVIREIYLQTATAGSLDRHGRAVGIVRGSGESDASYRLRIASEIMARRGGSTRPEIKRAIAGFLQASVDDIGIVENQDPTTGDYRAAYYWVEFDVGLLADAGFQASEYAEAISNLNALLDRLSAAGVYGEVRQVGGGVWDSAMWDVDVWGP